MMDNKNNFKDRLRESPKRGDGSGKKDYPGSGVKKRGHRRRQVRRRAAVLICLLVVAVFGILAAYFMPSGKRVDPAQYFAGKMLDDDALQGQDEADTQKSDGSKKSDPAQELSSEEALAQELRGDALAVVLQNAVDYRKALIREDVLYLNYEMVSEALNERFFWDEESRTMLFTTPLELYEIPENSRTYLIGGKESSFTHTIVFQEEDALYISAYFVQLFTNLEYVFGEDDCHVKINYQWGTRTCAEISQITVMREGPGRKTAILKDLAEGEEVTVLASEEKKWTLAVSSDGFIGYISNSALKEPAQKEFTRKFTEPKYTSIHLDEKVRLVWHAIDYDEVNQYFDKDTKSMTGINVISPTWFQIADNDGHISSLADKAYLRKARRMGLQVWPTLNNFNADVSTYQVVSSAASRRTLEEELMAEAEEFGLEGINIDLEMITADSAPGYVQLMRELSVLCRKAGLILSVDVPVPMPFNEYYNRKELGIVTDYVIMMGYDEHYYGSDAGSVASISFEEDGITQSLESIPADKLISGIPFYTRIWYSWHEEDGSDGLASDVISMYRAQEYLDDFGVTATWDEETGQNYAEWIDEDGTICRIWMEDEESIALKAELVDTYNLGGFGAWVLGDEKDTVWSVLEETVDG